MIAVERPDIHLCGQDFALPYCRSFAECCGPAVLADSRSPPFRADSFDGILAVTSLMYVPRAQVHATLRVLRTLLRSGGAMLSLDPGFELQRAIFAVRLGRGIPQTGGQGFGSNEYLECFTQSGFGIKQMGGNPHQSVALIIPGVGRTRKPWVSKLLSNLTTRDSVAGGYSALALHRWVLALRTESGR